MQIESLNEKPKNRPKPNSTAEIINAIPITKVGYIGVVALLITIVFGGLRFFTAPTTITVDTIAGTTLAPYEYPIYLPETRINVQRWIANSGGYGASFVINGKIQAGVKLDSPVTKMEDLGGNKFRITLPEASVTFCALDDPIQSDWSKSMVADWERAEDFARYQALTALRTTVASSDLLQQTEFKVTQVIRDLVSQIDARYELEFVFEDMGETRFDTTCQPLYPSGWQYDPALNQWTSS